MTSMLEQDPRLVVALAIGFLCLSSLCGGLLRPILGFLFLKKAIFFLAPFLTGAGGMLYLLN